MAIIVENGTIVAGANSYVSEAELTSYATARGVTLTGTPESLLIKAMDYVETQPFIGTKLTRDQPLQWPRSGVVIDGWSYPPSEIPDELKTAQMTVALAIDEGNDPLAPVSPAIKRKRVKADTVESETEYQDGASASSFSVTIGRAFAKLTTAGGGSSQFAVRRG